MIQKLTTQKQFEESYLISSYAFLSGNIESPADRQVFYDKCRFTDNYGIYEDEKLTNQLISHPFQANIFGITMSMGGIADVVSIPEKRGEGKNRLLFEKLFEDYRKTKTLISYLAPFSHRFYRNFGYATAFEDQFVTLSKYEINKLTSEKKGTFKLVDWQSPKDLQDLKSVYRSTLEKEHGALVRSDWWWDYIRAHYPKRFTVLSYNDEGSPEGYMMYELNGSDSTFSVRELAFQTYFSFSKLLTYMKNHTGSYDTFIIKSSPHNQWTTFLDEPAFLEKSLSASLMVRIILLEEFIKQFPFRLTSDKYSLILDVTDTHCPWNNHLWRLTIINGTGKLTKISSADNVDIAGTIESFTQLFLRIVSGKDLLFHEKIRGNKQSIDILDSLIPLEKPYAHDHF
ncbi:GNAT family N-acetyltransferase [Vagococcus elongatus]|uniref:GNAT family N-acetyltransferase n=1 Tax=Vagococcus elongatus TaxID=180344 RepID=A0A430ASI1_9ENTE|nr:GNAT family N-acetyltransferase [Vagococcus elongatus]RSU11018.1 hypothetical protein CBF29_08635 [Vagococcus elongatus]